MYYPDELVEEIREKNDIVDIISGYVKLQKKGSSYFGLCPFHSEKSPSFSVSPVKQMYYCFGCGAGGNVFSFLMNYENFTFQESVKALADRVNVELPKQEVSAEVRKASDLKAALLEINKEAARYFYYQLRSSQGEIGYRYFRGRGLGDDTLQKFGLGFANKTDNDLVLYLKNKGYKDDQIIRAGLASADERYGIHDKFWNRVMFPILDVNHRVIGFGGRVMGEGMPKYLNSPETPIFDKSRNLYGLNLARTSRRNHMILCEGYMDVISLHQAGFTQVVASLGTSFTTGQALLLRRYTDQVLLAYDSDGAGTNAALRALGILRENGLSGKVIDLSPYKDPDELIKEIGEDGFQDRINRAQNGFLFEIKVLESSFDLKDPEGKTAFYREIAARLCRFEEEMERSNYLDAVADQYLIRRESLKEMVQAYASRTGLAKPMARPKSGIQSADKEKNGAKKAQRLLITWLTEEPHLYSRIKEYLSAEDFTDELYRRVAGRLFEDFEAGRYSPAAILNGLEDEEQQRQAAELFNTKIMLSDSLTEREKAFHDILITVKQNSLEQDIGGSNNDITAIYRVLEAKKALEKLKNTHISLKE